MRDVERLAAGVLEGNRNVLARAITLVESTRPDDDAKASELIQRLLPSTGEAIRVGITGVPGVGKSTFIEALGGRLTAQGHRVAVLAVDPSSAVTGGSILGDKTRMPQLARNEAAFVRPSPGGSTLGGVARRTREALLVCEAAGFDVVLVETIGVGQSESAVAGMVDVFLLLILPGAGDELQGIKRGVTELADAVVVTKADGDNRLRAETAAAEYAAAFHLLHSGPGGPPPVVACSAVTGEGVDDVWAAAVARRDALAASGGLAERRRRQALRWMEDALEDRLRDRFLHHPDVAAALPGIREAVLRGELDPVAAARRLLELGR